MLKKFTQTDRHGNMMSKEMMGKFLKKKVIKDRHGNQMAFEFDIPESNVPPVNQVPQYSAEGGDIDNHPGGPKGSDTVPAWLTPGEFVVNKEATDLFGDTIKQMNEVGRQIQDQRGAQEDGLKQVPNHVYAAEGQIIPGEERQTSIHDLERDPMFQEQLNSMLAKWGGKGQFSKEQLYKVIAGESDFKAGVKTPKGSASGLFQFIQDTLNDMVNRNKNYKLIPKELLNKDGKLTAANVRAMTPAQQLKLYEGYLKGAGYEGDVHLGAMQGAPGYYKRMRGDANPKRIIFNKNGTDEERAAIASNKQWVNKDGNVTVGSIKSFYDQYGSDVGPQLMASNNQLAKWRALRDGTQFAGLGLIPGPSEFDGVPSIKTGLDREIQTTPNVPPGPASGAQSFPEVPSDTIPTGTALNENPVPTANFSANIPNYAAHNLEGSEFLGIPLNQSNWDTGAKRRTWQNNVGDTFANEFTGANTQYPVSQADIENFGGMDYNETPPIHEYGWGNITDLHPPVKPKSYVKDYHIDRRISQTPPTYPDAVMRAAEPPSDITSTGNWPPSANTSEYNFGRPSEASIAKAEMDERAKQQEYMDNFSPPELEKYIPNNFNIDDWSGYPGLEGWDKNTVDKFGDEIKGINEWGTWLVSPKDFGPQHDMTPKQKSGWKDYKETVKAAEIKAAKLLDVEKKTEKENNPDKDNQGDKAENAGKNAPQADQNKAMGFLKDTFGSLFNKQELKRMAIMYLGSRLMGYNHGGSLNFAAKNYLARVDALEASRLKFAHSDEAKNWDNVDEYLKTGDFSVMTPKGATTYRQGVFEQWYHKKSRKEITVEKVHRGKGDDKQVIYVDVATNKPVSIAHYDKTGLYSKNSPERRKVLKDFTESWTKILKDEHEMAFKTHGNKLLSVDKLNLRVAAGEAINEMLDKGASMSQAQAALPLAYRMAIKSEMAKGKRSVGVQSLKAALKAMYVERGTGLRDLFLTIPDKKYEKDWDGVSGKKDFVNLVEFEKARQNASLIMRSVPQFANMNPDEAANLYIMNLAKIWAGTRKLKDGSDDPENYTEADRRRHWEKTAEDESGFLHFMKKQLIIENEKRLGLNE